MASKVAHRHSSQITIMNSWVPDKQACAMKEFSTGMQHKDTKISNLTIVPKQILVCLALWMLQLMVISAQKLYQCCLVSVPTFVLNHTCAMDLWGYRYLSERRTQPVVPEKQSWTHHQDLDSALPPLSPKMPAMSSLTFLLRFEHFDLLTKIWKGDFFLISHFTSSFRRQGDEESIPSGKHVANGQI